MSTHRSFLSRPLLLAGLLLASLSLPAAAQSAAPKGKAEASKPAEKGARPTLVFFMNPAGRPCQTQDEILKQSRARWEPLASLRYVRTDLPGDRDAFYQYGIRSLPNMILVGPDGKELLRFSPGIQEADAIVSGIRSKTAR
jgi:hypothetical protein